MNHGSSSVVVHKLVNVVFLMTRWLSDFEKMAISPRTQSRLVYRRNST